MSNEQVNKVAFYGKKMTSPVYTSEDATKLLVKATRRLTLYHHSPFLTFPCFILLGHINNDILPCLL